MANPLIPNSYKFESIQRTLDFVKSLVVEGYPVVINTQFMSFPRENDIDYFEVTVGEKKNNIKVMIEDKNEN